VPVKTQNEVHPEYAVVKAKAISSSFNASEAFVKQRRLDEIAAELKTEFFGIDEIIDKVINLIRAWYIMPSILSRPVIVNLWGMTGVGKTQLVRRLAYKLGFSKKFVEVQMDGFSNGSGFNQNSISGILASSSIEEGETGILLLDEMQRFRTIDSAGQELSVERYQDVWMLLSDGKFSIDTSMFQELEMMLAYQAYSDDWQQAESSPKDKTKKTKRKFKIYPYEAKKLKKTLKRPESVAEIMEWDQDKVKSVLIELHTSDRQLESDYTKLLVFISGNLDEVFRNSTSVNDCDTDADVYHQITKLLKTTDVKEALSQRFKPEQIARFGNNNVIYPSLNRATYTKIIETTCDRYAAEIQELSGIKFRILPNVIKEIYDNAVFPTQGTRPVFSTIHQILGSGLSDLALWGFELGISNIDIDIDPKASELIGTSGKRRKARPVELELRKIRAKNTVNFNTMVAVHEMGHSIVYAALFGTVPSEVKINLASFNGGYMFPAVGGTNVETKKNVRDKICTFMAGAAAEEMVFGADFRSSGCLHDIHRATELAGKYVRQVGFDGFMSYITYADHNAMVNNDLDSTNASIEQIMKDEYVRAGQVLRKHRVIYRAMVDTLLDKKTFNREELIELLDGEIELNNLDDITPAYNDMWGSYKPGRK
jgi:hypothetical protein